MILKCAGVISPSTSQESQPQRQASRLAWCYGDLGVAVALWNAGKVLDDETLKTKAHEVCSMPQTAVHCGDDGLRCWPVSRQRRRGDDLPLHVSTDGRRTVTRGL